MQVRVEAGQLHVGSRQASVDTVEGFYEHHSGWTGRSWLEIRGTGLSVPIGEGYGAVRQVLREAFPDRPFESDWTSGRYPMAPWGLPADSTVLAVLLLATALALAVMMGLSVAHGALLLVLLVWSTLRLRDRLVVTRMGVRVGPPWAPLWSWDRVQAIQVEAGARGARVAVLAEDGGGEASLPVALLPALRARVRRLGGLQLDDWDAQLVRYARWRIPAAALPWGVAVAAVLAAPFMGGWLVVARGLWVAAGLALLGAAVEARATGWGAGGVFWLTALYGLLLTLLSFNFL